MKPTAAAWESRWDAAQRSAMEYDFWDARIRLTAALVDAVTGRCTLGNLMTRCCSFYVIHLPCPNARHVCLCIKHSRLRRLWRLMVVRIREEVDGARFVDRFSSVSSVSGISW